MQKKRFATMSIIAAAALSMGLTACVDNEEGDGLKALREGVGDYYQGKGENERAQAHLTEAKIKLETANGAAKEIENAYNDAANKIKLIVEQSNADKTVAGNNVKIIEDTAGIANKILKAQLDEAAKVITSDEALQKLKIAYEGVIAGYKEDLEDTKMRLLWQAQGRADSVNLLDVRIAKAAIEYAANIDTTKISAENEAANNKAKVEKDAATDKQTRENDKAENAQQILVDKITSDLKIQGLIAEYNQTNAEYLALVEYNKLAPSAKNDSALAEKKIELSNLNLEVSKKLLELAGKELENANTAAGNANEADLKEVEQSIINELTSNLDSYVKAIEDAQDKYTNALLGYDLYKDDDNDPSTPEVFDKHVDGYNEVNLELVAAQKSLFDAVQNYNTQYRIKTEELRTTILNNQIAFDKADKNLTEAKEKLDKAKENYDKNHETYETEYKNAQTAYENAVKAQATAAKDLATKQNELSTLSDNYGGEDTDPNSLWQLNKAVVEAQKNADEAKNLVDAKKTTLDYANKVLAEAKANYEAAKAIIDKAIEG